MSRKFLIPILAAAFLAAPAFAPAQIAAGLSGSAQAVKNLNTSRSNIYRTSRTGKATKRAVKIKQPVVRARPTTVSSFKSNQADRIGRGYARQPGGAANAVSLNSSRSNIYRHDPLDGVKLRR